MFRKIIRISARAGAACALAMALLTPPAAAQSDDNHYGPYAGSSWSVKKVRNGNGECTMIVNHGAMGLDAAGTKIVKERYGSGGVSMIEWTGSCNAEGLINGRGTLYIDLDDSGDNYSKRFIGTADRGIFDGAVRYNPFFDVDLAELGVLDPDQSVTFVNGCNNWLGARPNSCDTRRATQLRSEYLTAAPATAGGGKPVGPVAVDIPPSATGSLNREQNDAAAAWLKADTEAKRVQAEKVADFERKQAEFNKQQSDYQRQQADYQAAVAKHQAEVDRIAKLNADIAACNAGDKSRCP